LQDEKSLYVQAKIIEKLQASDHTQVFKQYEISLGGILEIFLGHLS
jgi:hypothetical protein